MSKPRHNTSLPFLQGGGEMGELTRAYDWSKTSLGPPETWPQSLRITLGNVLNSGFPMFLFWGDDLVCFYNDAFRPSLGANGKHPALGKKGREVWSEIWEIVGSLITGVMETGKPVWNENMLIPFYRNGKIEDIYWTYSYSVVLNDEGLAGGVLVTCMETTQVVIEQAKAKKARIYDTIISSTPDLVYVFELDYTFSFVNKALLTMWGKTWDDAINKGLRENGYEEWHALMHEREIDQVAATGQSVRGEVSFPHAELGSRVYDYILVPVFNAAGKVESVAGTTRDITELKLAERKLRESEERFRTMAEGTSIYIAVGDTSSNATYFNKAWTDLTGRSMDKLVEFGWADLLHPDDKGQYVDIYLDAFKLKQPFEGEFRVLNKLGEYRWLLANGVPRFHSDNIFLGYISACVDITERKRNQFALEKLQQELENEVNLRTEELAATNEELQATNEELSATNEELSESSQQLLRSNEELGQFAYAASHDLQEPLRKIQTFADRLLRVANLPEQNQDWISRINQSAIRMSQLIKNLLEFSSLIKPEESFERVDLNTIISETMKDFEHIIEEKKVNLTITKLPALQASRVQMQQLFGNLISNALKFVRAEVKPVIAIQYEVISAKDARRYVQDVRVAAEYHHITVSDNGIGFEKQYAEHIFEVFRRLHGRGEYKGSGIGLALCKRIVTNHKGYISADSEPGKGSTFHILLGK